MLNSLDIYPEEYFVRQDDNDDALFYAMPRKVVHIDAEAIDTLADFYAEVLPPRGSYLDLMSSWRSHFPAVVLEPKRLAGLGLNAEEMLDNPQLDDNDIWIQNLNLQPELPFADGEFDGALCAVSVQYLVKPIEVFQEVLRILKPGGTFVVAFSNRCFPTKATAVWTATGDQDHIQLVASYFQNIEGWVDLGVRIKPSDPEVGNDPLFIVWARKEGV